MGEGAIYMGVKRPRILADHLPCIYNLGHNLKLWGIAERDLALKVARSRYEDQTPHATVICLERLINFSKPHV